MEKYYGLLKQCTRKNAYRQFMNMNKAKSQQLNKEESKCYVPCYVKPKMMVVQWERICLPVQETQVWSLDQEDPLEEEIATHSVFLPGKIPWTEKTGGLQPIRLQRVGHAWVTEHACTPTVTHTHVHKHGKWQQNAHSITPTKGNRRMLYFLFSWLPSVSKSWYTIFCHD